MAIILGACGAQATQPLSKDASVDVYEASNLTCGSVVPDVVTTRSCATAKAGTACVESGWFCMSRWSTAHWEHSLGAVPFSAEPTSATYLDAFSIDPYEVTMKSYADYVATTGASPPPDSCGYTAPLDGDPMDGTTEQVSGWSSGVPIVGFDDHPVICVTRTEARAYCASKGGHLPSVAEWLKSGRGLAPDVRRFPWGDSPPADDPSVPWSAASDQYIYIASAKAGLNTAAVDGTSLGVSPWGVFGLSGNAGELVETCLEDLANVYPSVNAIVRPEQPSHSVCASSVLVAGSNWLSWADIESPEALSVFSFAMGDILYVGAEQTFPEKVWSRAGVGPIAGKAGTDPNGNDRRDWRAGFRCAYDVQ